MINNVVLVGRLTRDPEMRYTQNGIAVTNFRIAVDRRFGRDEQGNKPTDFIDIAAWRKTGELCAQFLSKGALVGIEGRLQVRNWTAQDGQSRTSYEVQAENVSFLESKAERERRESARGDGGYSRPPPPPQQQSAPPPPPTTQVAAPDQPSAPAGPPAQDENPPASDLGPPPMDGDDPFGDQ